MGLLSGLLGGGKMKTQTSTQTQTLPDWQLPYVQQGMSEAQRLYYGGGLPMMGGGSPGIMVGQPAMQPTAMVPGGYAQPTQPTQPGQMPSISDRMAAFRVGNNGGMALPRGVPMQGTGYPGGNGMAAGGMPGPGPGVPTNGGNAVGPTGQPIQSGIYQGATVGGLSATSRAGIDAITGAATGGNFGLEDSAAGKYLNGNPYLDTVIGNTTRGIDDNFRRSVMPGIESAAGSRGRLGSGWEMGLRHDASGVLGQQLSDTEAGMRMSNYNNERGIQVGAQGALMNNRNTTAAALLGAGNMVDSRNDARMADAAGRYERTQAEPMDRLRNYMALVSGNVGGTTTGTQPISRDRAGGILGGALAGARLGNMTGLGGGWGAAAGGLLSMFG